MADPPTPARETSLAPQEPTASAPASTVVRQVEVALAPDAIFDALAAQPRMVARGVDHDRRHERKSFDGTIFQERTDDGLILWRRPETLWVDRLRDHREAVPYPDTLRIRVSPTARGSRVMMSWERHPLTRSTLVLTLLGVMALLGVMLVSGNILLSGLLAVMVSIAPLFRFSRLRRARGSLLQAAYRALAPHELGEAGREGSAFRSRLASGQPHLPRLGPSDDDR